MFVNNGLFILILHLCLFILRYCDLLLMLSIRHLRIFKKSVTIAKPLNYTVNTVQRCKHIPSLIIDVRTKCLCSVSIYTFLYNIK